MTRTPRQSLPDLLPGGVGFPPLDATSPSADSETTAGQSRAKQGDVESLRKKAAFHPICRPNENCRRLQSLNTKPLRFPEGYFCARNHGRDCVLVCTVNRKYGTLCFVRFQSLILSRFFRIFSARLSPLPRWVSRRTQAQATRRIPLSRWA